MKRNMGTIDRAMRLLGAALLVGISSTLHPSGTLGVTLAAVAVLFTATGLTGWCPLYVPLGISTCRDVRTAASKTSLTP